VILGGRIEAITESYNDLIRIAERYENLRDTTEGTELIDVTARELISAASELANCCELLISRMNGDS